MKIPILMYHALARKESELQHPIQISETMFAQQMEWLHQQGYQTINVNELLCYLRRKEPLEKKFLLTFDDGFYSQYKIASPILEKYDFQAALFLVTNSVGQNSFDKINGINPEHHSKIDRPLTWEELTEMQSKGWSIQAHTCNHPNLIQLSKTKLKQELIDSRQAIEENLGEQVNSISYPFGAYSNSVLKVVEKNNYKIGFAVHSGLATSSHDIFRLPRIEITNQMNLDDFIKNVELGFSSKLQKRKALIRDFFFKSSWVKDFFGFIGRIK